MDKKIEVEKRKFLAWLLNIIEADHHISPDDDIFLGRLVAFSTAVHATFEDLLDYEKKVLTREINWGLQYIKEIRSALLSFIGDTRSLVGRKRKFLAVLPPLTAALDLHNSDKFQLLFFPGRSPSSEQERIKWLSDIAILNFGFLLNGLRVDSIKQCSECDSFFINPSRKRKEYCNPHCTWKAISRKKREKIKARPSLYRAYLKKQSAIMHESYVKRVRKKIPKASVKRRPWRHITSRPRKK